MMKFTILTENVFISRGKMAIDLKLNALQP